MRKFVLLGVAVALVLGLSSSGALASYTMSWSFQLINNPNARQIALNVANTQQELSKVEEEPSGIERFQESLDRMAMSKAIRDIVYFEPDPNDPNQQNQGFIPVDDGWIYYEWDPVDEITRIYHYTDGGWTEITIDTSSPPAPPGP